MSHTFSPCPSCGKVNRVALSEASSKEPICGHCKTPLSLHFNISEVNGTGLKNLIEKSSLPVVVDFWAPWCGPCKAFAPTFQKAAHEFGEKAVFVKLNTEAHPAAGELYKVRSIPTLAVFSGGQEKQRLSGALPYDDFVGWLSEAVSL